MQRRALVSMALVVVLCIATPLTAAPLERGESPSWFAGMVDFFETLLKMGPHGETGGDPDPNYGPYTDPGGGPDPNHGPFTDPGGGNADKYGPYTDPGGDPSDSPESTGTSIDPDPDPTMGPFTDPGG